MVVQTECDVQMLEFLSRWWHGADPSPPTNHGVKHMAVIMDGNRRFAKSMGKTSETGHRMGKEKLKELLKWMIECDVKYVTVYALSVDNLNRSERELNALNALFVEGLDEMSADPQVHSERVRVRVVGDPTLWSTDVERSSRRLEQATVDYESYHFTVCLAYGGREELRHAFESAVCSPATSSDSTDTHLTGSTDVDMEEHLWTAPLPDVDLLVRTGGERRVSNFLLWKIAYSELYFLDKHWPQLSKADIVQSLQWFASRTRRFGR